MRWLCDQINAGGHAHHGDDWREIKPSRIEYWLQHGLIPQPARPGRGRRQGRDVIYTDTHVRAAAEVWDLMRRYRSTNKTLVVLFARGRPVDHERLRTALLALLENTQQQVAADMRRATNELRAIDAGNAAASAPTLLERMDAATSFAGRRIADSHLAPVLKLDATKPRYQSYEEMAAPLLQALLDFGQIDAAPAIEALGLPQDALPSDALTAASYRQVKERLANATPEDLGAALTAWPTLLTLMATVPGLQDIVHIATAMNNGTTEYARVWTSILTGLAMANQS